MAVMHTILTTVIGERLPHVLAGWHLRDAIATLEAVELEIDLFDGFSGVAWSILACRQSGVQPAGLDESAIEAHLTRIDDVLGEWLEEVSGEDVAAFERGLGALSVYALERTRSGAGSRLIDAVLERILDLGVDAWSTGVDYTEVTSWLHLLARISRTEGPAAVGQKWRDIVPKLTRALSNRLDLSPSADSLVAVCTMICQAIALADLESDQNRSTRALGRLDGHALLQASRHCTSTVLNPDDQVCMAWLCANLGARFRNEDWIAQSARGYNAAIHQLGRRPVTDHPPRQLSDKGVGLPYGQAATVIHWLPAVASAVPDLSWICSLRSSSPPTRQES